MNLEVNNKNLIDNSSTLNEFYNKLNISKFEGYSQQVQGQTTFFI